ncbi:hypothetical protein DL96DRAFT_1551713 [Flagelloscypha sp. PMI_526]|nr:hypothetical protein DL96DRAFT_1551713 [Flagelloscypha sp. PMI_526]
MTGRSQGRLLLPLIFVSSFAAGIFYYLAFTDSFYGIRLPQIYTGIMSSTTTTAGEWKSDHEGWFGRIPNPPQPDPESFFPKKEDLLLAVLRNSRVEPEGFTLAIFSSSTSDEKLLVDAQGRLFKVPTSHIQGVLDLASTVSATFPKPNMFRNTWMIKSPMTGQPIERIIVPTSEGRFDQTSVSGFKKERGARPELKEKVGDEYDTLPKELGELAGLVLEAREGYQNGQAGVLVRRVIDLLPDSL